MAFSAQRVNSVTTGDGAAAGMFAGLYGLRVGRDLVQRLAHETVEHPPSLATIADQLGVLQHFEMKGEARLRDLEHLLELAHAAFLVRQHLDDLNAGFVRQSVKPTGNDGGVGSCGGGSCHAPTYQLFLIRQGARRNSRTNASGGSRSGRTVGSNPISRSSPSVSPGTAFLSCLRRRLKHAVTNARSGATSTSMTSGWASGVIRISALRTFGGGRKAPGATVNSFSTRATACTPTDNAP